MENNIIQLDAAAETQRFMVKVYAWMSLALAITGFTAVFTAGNATLFSLIFSQSWVWIGLIILEFVLVAYLSIWIAKMSAQRATIVFIL